MSDTAEATTQLRQIIDGIISEVKWDHLQSIFNELKEQSEDELTAADAIALIQTNELAKLNGNTRYIGSQLCRLADYVTGESSQDDRGQRRDNRHRNNQNQSWPRRERSDYDRNR